MREVKQVDQIRKKKKNIVPINLGTVTTQKNMTKTSFNKINEKHNQNKTN